MTTPHPHTQMRKYRVAYVGIGPDGVGTAVVDTDEQAHALETGTLMGLAVFGRFIGWITPWVEYEPPSYVKKEFSK